MNRRVKLLLLKAFVVFHLGCMLVYTGRILEILPQSRATSLVTHAVTTYSKITMTNYRFAFFAPFIPPYYTIEITGETKKGASIPYKLPQPNREIEIRFNRMLRNIPENKLREPMFRSWADYIRAKHPEVDSVTIHVFQTDLPPMEDFVNGKEKETKLVYNFKF